MNTNIDPEAVLAAWLDDGPTDLPDATRRAILTSLPTTPQARRGLLAPRRSPAMNIFARGAAVLVVAVVAIGALALFAGPRLGVGSPSPSPSQTNPASSQVDPCIVGTWTTTPLTQHSPVDAEASFSGGAGEIYTIDAQGNVTIDTHAAKKTVFVEVPNTFTATPSGTGHGTLWTLTSGDTHLFQYTPSADSTLSTAVVDSNGVSVGPAKPDLAYSAIYTCTPGTSLTFYNSTPVQYILDGALITLTAGSGSSSPAASPSASK